MAEYYRHRAYYDLVLLTPYALAALIVTIVGCGVAPRVVLASKLLSANALVGTGIGTFVLVAALALASDVGSHLQFWSGPMFFLHGSWQVSDLFVLSKLFLPISGLAAAGKSPTVASAPPRWIDLTSGSDRRSVTTDTVRLLYASVRGLKLSRSRPEVTPQFAASELVKSGSHRPELPTGGSAELAPLCALIRHEPGRQWPPAKHPLLMTDVDRVSPLRGLD